MSFHLCSAINTGVSHIWCYFHNPSWTMRTIFYQISYTSSTNLDMTPCVQIASSSCRHYSPQWWIERALSSFSMRCLQVKAVDEIKLIYGALHREHYSDVIMSVMASHITSLTIAFSTIYSGAGQRKHHVTDLCVGNSPVTGGVARMTIWGCVTLLCVSKLDHYCSR